MNTETASTIIKLSAIAIMFLDVLMLIGSVTVLVFILRHWNTVKKFIHFIRIWSEGK